MGRRVVKYAETKRETRQQLRWPLSCSATPDVTWWARMRAIELLPIHHADRAAPYGKHAVQSTDADRRAFRRLVAGRSAPVTIDWHFTIAEARLERKRPCPSR